MLNQTVLVGRLTDYPEMKELENGNKITEITLAVPRSYKNANGEYDSDYIPVITRFGMAENTINYITKGDLVGIKGRIESIKDLENEGKFNIAIMAERITFLSAYKDNELEDDKEEIQI